MRDWQAFVRERLGATGLTREREARIVRELAAQLEDFYREAVASGATDVDADAFACRQIQDWPRMAHELRLADRPHLRPPLERAADALDRRHRMKGPASMLADALRDMRYAARQLAATPGFTAVAVLTLGVGIGVTSAMFSVVNGVLLRPLPYGESEGLVRVHELVPNYGRFSVAPANFLDWRRQNAGFERIGAMSGGSATLMAGEDAERIPVVSVSWDMFDLLRATPLLGRTFREDEDTPGRNDVVILSYGAWQRRFGGDAAILNRTITLDGAAVTVVGVMRADFYFPNREAELWRPIALDTTKASRGGHFLAVVARLKPGTTLDAATSDMKGLAGRLAAQYPGTNADESAEVVPLLEQTVGRVRPALLTLMAAVGVIVLIACANVANLLLVRASVRSKEIAIRSALGAGRARLVLQMLAESTVLALAGGGVGLLLAWLAITPVKTLGATSIPRVADIGIDGHVLLFALAVSAITGLLFGLAPAWQGSRGSVGQVLKEGGRTSATSTGRWLRNGLLIAEVALSIVLLVGAALLLRSFARLTAVDPGFNADNVLSFRVSLPARTYKDAPDRVRFFDRLSTDLAATPGVTSVGMVQSMPMRDDFVLSFSIEGRPPARPGQEPSANYRSITAGYFKTLGIPLKRGRFFDQRDTAAAPMVAVVDEAFVQQHFPNEDPLGRGLDIGNGTDGFFRIVGVVANVHYDALDAESRPTMYVPFAQDDFGSMWVMARTAGEPEQLSGTVRQLVQKIDQTLPAYSIAPLADVVTESVARQRFSMALLAVFAGTALFLAAVGLYGVVAFGVRQRTQEIGVRMAMGARQGQVLALILSGGMRLVLVGVALGLVGALALSKSLTAMLFGITPLDPISYVMTSALLLAVAALACYIPARRAMRVDPLVALRQT